LRDEELRLREAEVQEMKEIAEQEAARAKADLAQERVRLARLRESLRLDGVSPPRREEPAEPGAPGRPVE
jgi:hypothetical protein